MNFAVKIFKGDKKVWALFVLFYLISVVAVYSASSTLTFRTNYWIPILQHCTNLSFGGIIVWSVHTVKPKYFKALILILPVAWLLLIATRCWGTPINGSYRFFAIGGFSFQPSELAKLCLIAFTAYRLDRQKDSEADKSYQWIIGATLITCGIIFIDNGSTAIIVGITIFLMMIIGQIPIKKLIKLALIALAIATVAFCFLRFVPKETIKLILPRSDTWVERVKDFGTNVNIKDENFAIDDNNYQIAHSRIAIANGGLFGKLPGHGSERDFLPQAYSDFIYAIIIEESGLVGGFFILLFYIFLFVQAGKIARHANKHFSKFMVIGVSLMIFIQALANMAVTVSIIPVTGQTLPLISRGGTSILITCVYFGIILSVSRYEDLNVKRKTEGELVMVSKDADETDDRDENTENE
jgi:cell division protein FtsW